MNTFIVAPQVQQELGNFVDIIAPLIDTEDVKRHGVRKFDVHTRYAATDADLLTMTQTQRQRLVEWHVLNPYFLSGQIALGTGRPEIHIGQRVRIPQEGASVLGEFNQREEETYYVEGVAHDWRFGEAIKTRLGVTRGWRGTDESLLQKIEELSSDYLSPRAFPTEGALGAGGELLS